MEDNNEGFTNTDVVSQGAKENIVNAVNGKIELIRHINTEVARIPPNQQLDIPQFGDVGNKMLTDGANALAVSISNIAEVARENWRKETTNKLALKAQAAQGTNIAINSIAVTKKRDPFMASILGQTVTSRVAEAQSVQNATTALYNESSENMAKLAELPTEAAMEVLASKGEELVAEIKDPEMRQLAMDNLLAQMPKLAQAHHKERYALTRNKQVQNNRENIVNKRIEFEHDRNIASLLEEKVGLQSLFNASIYKPNDPTGQQNDLASVREYRSLVHTQAATDLRNGNKTLYDAIRGIPEGDRNALTQLEAEGFKDAVNAYDTTRNTMAGQVIAEAEYGILAAESPEEADAAAQIARQQLADWAGEGTRSDIDKKNVAVRKTQLERLLKRNKASWAKNQVDAERTAQLDNAHNLSDAEYVKLAGTASKEELKYLSNIQLSDFITETSGMPKDQARQVSLSVFETGLHFKDKHGERHLSAVTVAKMFLRSMRDKAGVVPDVVQNYIDTKMIGMRRGEGNAEDEKGYSQKQRDGFRVLEVLAELPGVNMTEDENVHLEFMRRGFNANESPESIEASFREYKDNKGMKDQSLVPRKERKENFRNLVTELIEHKPSDRIVSQYEEMYSHIAQSVGYDHKIAEAVFKREVRRSSSTVQGLVVSNGRKLDKDLGGKYNLRELLNNMGTVTKESELGMTISLGTPIMMAMFGAERDADQKTLTDTSRLQFTSIEYSPGDDSVEFKPVGGQLTRIPMKVLQDASKMLEVARLKADMIKAIDKQMTLEGRDTQLHYMGPQAADIMRTVYDTGTTTGIRNKEPTKKHSAWIVRQALSIFGN